MFWSPHNFVEDVHGLSRKVDLLDAFWSIRMYAVELDIARLFVWTAICKQRARLPGIRQVHEPQAALPAKQVLRRRLRCRRSWRIGLVRVPHTAVRHHGRRALPLSAVRDAEHACRASSSVRSFGS